MLYSESSNTDSNPSSINLPSEFAFDTVLLVLSFLPHSHQTLFSLMAAVCCVLQHPSEKRENQ